MSLTPLPNPNTYPHFEASSDQELPDIRLTAADRELVKRVIAQLEQRLGVDGLMFAAAGCEDAAIRRRAAEEAAGR